MPAFASASFILNDACPFTVASDAITVPSALLIFTSIMCRIRGKMKRRTWIREGDVVLVSPWDFQSEERGEIFHRYTANQVDELRQKGVLLIE